jgi:hypothetical protein
MTLRFARTALVVMALLACGGLGFGVHGLLSRPAPAVPAAAPPPIATADALQSAFVSVAERVLPTIRSSRTSSTSSSVEGPPAAVRSSSNRVSARA